MMLPCPPPPPPGIALTPTTVFSGVLADLTVAGSSAATGNTFVFLPAGTADCVGAAAKRVSNGGAVSAQRKVSVRLPGPAVYKLCLSRDPHPTLDADFEYISNVQLVVTHAPSPSPPLPPHPLTAVLAATLVLALVVLALVWRSRKEERRRRAVQDRAHTSTSSDGQPPAESGHGGNEDVQVHAPAACRRSTSAPGRLVAPDAQRAPVEKTEVEVFADAELALDIELERLSLQVEIDAEMVRAKAKASADAVLREQAEEEARQAAESIRRTEEATDLNSSWGAQVWDVEARQRDVAEVRAMQLKWKAEKEAAKLLEDAEVEVARLKEEAAVKAARCQEEKRLLMEGHFKATRQMLKEELRIIEEEARERREEELESVHAQAESHVEEAKRRAGAEFKAALEHASELRRQASDEFKASLQSAAAEAEKLKDEAQAEIGSSLAQALELEEQSVMARERLQGEVAQLGELRRTAEQDAESIIREAQMTARSLREAAKVEAVTEVARRASGGGSQSNLSDVRRGLRPVGKGGGECAGPSTGDAAGGLRASRPVEEAEAGVELHA